MKKVIARAILASMAFLAAVSCGTDKGWRQPRPVSVSGGEIWAALEPSFLTRITVMRDGNPGGLLLRDGDLVIVDDNCVIYSSADGSSLDARAEDGRLLLAGKTVSLSLGEREAGWLEQASTGDLQSLRFVVVSGSPPEESMPALKKLAAVNPGIGMSFDSMEALSAAAPLFAPRVLFLNGGFSDGEMAEMLAAEKQVETLSLSAADAKTLDFLAELPNLRKLFLSEWDPAATGPLPKGLNRIDSLIISQSDITDAGALANLPQGLAELSILACEGYTDVSGLARFANLRTLVLNLSPGAADLSGLKDLKNLQWVGLPSGVTQQGFADFAAAHRNLKVLEIVRCGSVSDLSLLKELTGLTGLVLYGSFGGMDAVRGLESLAFISLGMESIDKTREEMAALREALPKTMIVNSAPLCLGSGWILFLFPAAGLLWLGRAALRRRVNRRPARG